MLVGSFSYACNLSFVECSASITVESFDGGNADGVERMESDPGGGLLVGTQNDLCGFFYEHI